MANVAKVRFWLFNRSDFLLYCTFSKCASHRGNVRGEMKLYSAKIPKISEDLIKQLVEDGDIEVESREEAQLDIQSVLNEYKRMDREITEKSKDLIENRNLPHGHFSKVKRLEADRRGFGLGEDGIIWICNQILETMMQSNFVEEIFASDADMRRKMKVILHRHMMVDEEMDFEVRQRIKNLQEGGDAWNVEYSKVMDQIRNKRGLKD